MGDRLNPDAIYAAVKFVHFCWNDEELLAYAERLPPATPASLEITPSFVNEISGGLGYPTEQFSIEVGLMLGRTIVGASGETHQSMLTNPGYHPAIRQAVSRYIADLAH